MVMHAEPENGGHHGHLCAGLASATRERWRGRRPTGLHTQVEQVAALLQEGLLVHDPGHALPETLHLGAFLAVARERVGRQPASKVHSD